LRARGKARALERRELIIWNKGRTMVMVGMLRARVLIVQKRRRWCQPPGLAVWHPSQWRTTVVAAAAGMVFVERPSRSLAALP